MTEITKSTEAKKDEMQVEHTKPRLVISSPPLLTIEALALAVSSPMSLIDSSATSGGIFLLVVTSLALL